MSVLKVGQNAVKNEAALMATLGDASNKLDAAKLLDAAQKVADYQAKLNQLFSSGKIDAASYTELSTGATGVQSCIAGIGK